MYIYIFIYLFNDSSLINFFRGDIIDEVDGKKVTGVRDILDAIGFDVGKEIILKIKRNQYEDLTFRVLTAPEKS